MQGEASTRLGFTDYFRVELAWAKLLGAVLCSRRCPTTPAATPAMPRLESVGSEWMATSRGGGGSRRR